MSDTKWRFQGSRGDREGQVSEGLLGVRPVSEKVKEMLRDAEDIQILYVKL